MLFIDEVVTTFSNFQEFLADLLNQTDFVHLYHFTQKSFFAQKAFYESYGTICLKVGKCGCRLEQAPLIVQHAIMYLSE